MYISTRIVPEIKFTTIKFMLKWEGREHCKNKIMKILIYKNIK
jgi:hypothetical protein